MKLHGNIELAPLTGLAERIVDITATGTTLRENNLVIVEDVLSSTARFFANGTSLRTDARIVELADAMRAGAAAGKWECSRPSRSLNSSWSGLFARRCPGVGRRNVKAGEAPARRRGPDKVSS